VAVDRDPDLLAAALAHPWYRGNRVPRCADAEAILDQFARIFVTPIERVAGRRGLVRRLGLDHLPDAAASVRRRITRKWRQWKNRAAMAVGEPRRGTGRRRWQASVVLRRRACSTGYGR